MQRDTDRDRAIEHVLRQVSAEATADDRACIDGETLAAWSERQLRGAAADAVERHLSTCARCQQLLAAFARTAPAPLVHVPLWRRWRLQWLVPVATAATVAAIWVAMPRQERSAYLTVPSSSQAARMPESAPVPPSAPSQSAPADGVPRQERDTSSARENEATIPDRKARSPQPAPGAPAAKREELERRLDDANPVVELQKAQPPPATTADANAPARDAASVGGVARDSAGARVQAESAQRPAPSAAAANAPPAAPPAASEPPERRAATASRRERVPATASPREPPPATASPRERPSATALETATFRQAVTMVEIVSPNPSNRWRIIGGQVERTTNGGAQWTAVTLPAAGPLTAGSSPAPSICWIVGRGGVVYITTDGSQFARVNFPDALDLISVTAADDRRATVTAADGRTFSTADRGNSWSSVPR